MDNRFGITEEGLQVALKIKQHYKSGQPICLPGDRDDILIPEHLLNDNLDLLGFDDPLPLAMVASRDPEPPMAMAAAARLSPRALPQGWTRYPARASAGATGGRRSLRVR